MRKPVLLLVDGHNVAYRVYHAVVSMKAPDGQTTNALFGFIRTLDVLRNRVQPTHICIVFDGGLPAARIELWEAYKAQRAPMPDDLRSQFDLLDQYLDAEGIRGIRVPGEEADDLLATLARAAEPEADCVYLASTDRDMMQVVGPVIRMIEPSRKATITDADAVRRKTGVAPRQVLAWRALVGDSSDNIPGVPGVGPKTAARILQQFDALETVWERLAEVQPVRIRDRLKDHRDLIERNLSLMRLNESVACPLAWRDCVPGERNEAALAALWRRAGFRSKLREQAQNTQLELL